jgi:hypothetical protein
MSGEGDDPLPIPNLSKFFLSPAGVNSTETIDYSTPVGVKIYEKGCKPFDTKFNGGADQLTMFLAAVQYKGVQQRWENVLNVPTGEGDKTFNIVTEYGKIKLEHVRAHAKKYISDPGRAYQNDHMLFNTVYDSLTDKFKSKVELQRGDYNLEINGLNHNSGLCLLQVIISNTVLDTNATVLSLRQKLADSKQTMVSLGYNIEEFNAATTRIIEALAARGPLRKTCWLTAWPRTRRSRTKTLTPI